MTPLAAPIEYAADSNPGLSNVWQTMLLDKVAERLQSLRDLDAGWDGYHAPKISSRTITFSIELFAGVARPGIPLPSVVPTVNGGVQFEWHTPQHHVELEVEKEGEFTLFVMNRGDGNSELYEANNEAEVRSALTNVLAG